MAVRLPSPADYYQTSGEVLQDFLQQGYGRALDFVMDGVIDAFAKINAPLGRVLAR